MASSTEGVSARRRRRHRWLVVPALLTAVLALPGCANRLANPDQLEATIRQQVPGVTEVTSSASGDGFEYRKSLDMRVVLGVTQDVGAARATVRTVAKIAWLSAEADADHVTVVLEEPLHPGTPCDPYAHLTASRDRPVDVDMITCRNMKLDIPGAAAKRLWGDSHSGDRDTSYAGGQDFGYFDDLLGTESLPQGWGNEVLISFDPKLTMAIIVPDDVPVGQFKEGADQVARIIWHDHPDRIVGLELTLNYRTKAQRPPHSTNTSTPSLPYPGVTVSYSLEDLRRLGPRAPDLS